MNTLVKIAAGFTATATGVLALIVLRNKINREKQDSLDRITSRKTDSKPSSAELHQERIEDNFRTDFGSTSHKDHTPVVNYKAPVQKVQHHQKGIRHH